MTTDRLLIAAAVLACVMAAIGAGGCDAESAADSDAAPAAEAISDWDRELGRTVYEQRCGICHQMTGDGVPYMQPALAGSAMAVGDPDRLIHAVLVGIGDGEGSLPASDEYDMPMPAAADLSDEEIAACLSFVRTSWGNDAPPIDAALVRDVRERTDTP